MLKGYKKSTEGIYTSLELANETFRSDTCGFFWTFCGKNFLLLVDSHSKWLEVEILNNTNTIHTISTLRKWFSQFGVPVQLVSDNGPQFTSDRFREFMKMNGIKYIFASAYHPSSNGGADRFVQTVKKGLKAARIDKGDAEIKLRNFLLGYRSTPSSTTGMMPADIFLGRRIRTRLDLIKPDIAQIMKNYNADIEFSKQTGRQEIRIFETREKVLVRNHFGKPKWLSGTIIAKIADRTYSVNIGHRNVKRHIDHIVRNKGNVILEKNNNDQDPWYIGTEQMDEQDVNIEPRENAAIPAQVQEGNQQCSRKIYPARTRKPVSRYGLLPPD